MEAPKLILTQSDDHFPTSAMCSICHALFPTFKNKSAEANKELLERCFQQHVKAEHSGQGFPGLEKTMQGQPVRAYQNHSLFNSSRN